MGVVASCCLPSAGARLSTCTWPPQVNLSSFIIRMLEKHAAVATYSISTFILSFSSFYLFTLMFISCTKLQQTQNSMSLLAQSNPACWLKARHVTASPFAWVCPGRQTVELTQPQVPSADTRGQNQQIHPLVRYEFQINDNHWAIDCSENMLTQFCLEASRFYKWNWKRLAHSWLTHHRCSLRLCNMFWLYLVSSKMRVQETTDRYC